MELLESIQLGMRLDKGFFLKVYGYELTWPGFADTVLHRLEQAGCSNAQNYYNSIVTVYESKRDKEMKEVSVWYREQLAKETENKKRKAASEARNREKSSNAKWLEGLF